MLLANVEDHSRRTGKIIAVHQLFTVGAGHVIDRDRPFIRLFARHEKKDAGLIFLFCADIFEGLGIAPKASAFLTFEQGNFLYLELVEAGFTAWAFSSVLFRRNYDRNGFGAAVRTVFAADKHQAEAGWTPDRFEARMAKITERRITKRARSAIGTI